MKKTIIALSVAAFAMGIGAGAMAETKGKPCNPPKPGYVLDATGKCVKAPSAKTIKQ